MVQQTSTQAPQHTFQSRKITAPPRILMHKTPQKPGVHRSNPPILRPKSGVVEYYGYRDYDAASGRWTARDPIAEQGGLNLYGMIGNAPIERADVLGLNYYPESRLPRALDKKSCPQNIVVMIGGLWDDEGGLVGGSLYWLFTNYFPIPSSIVSYYHWNSGHAKLLQDIEKYRSCCPKSNTIIIGHSYGGDTGVDVANLLKKRNGLIVVATLDPVSSFDKNAIVGNMRGKFIDHWINSYVEKGVGDIMAPIPVLTHIWGLFVGGIESALSDRTIADAIASSGGRWGHESSADVNIMFDASDKKPFFHVDKNGNMVLNYSNNTASHYDASTLFYGTPKNVKASAFKSILDKINSK